MREREQNRPPRFSAAEGRQIRGWMQDRYGVVEAGEINQRPDGSPNDSTLPEPFAQNPRGMVVDGQGIKG